MRDLVIIVNNEEYSMISDFSAYVARYIIGNAEPKIAMESIPYSDGVLDYTDSYGDVKYKNRILTFPMIFVCDNPQESHSRISNLFNGMRCKVKTSTDPDWYWEGRVIVGGLETNKTKWTFDINVNADPYKYKDRLYTVTSPATATCISGRKRVIPKITTSDIISITFGDYTGSMDAGTHKDYNIVFSEGNNVLEFTGTSNVTIEYKEGSL